MNILYLINARINLLNIHDIYNVLLINYNKILKKKSFFCVKTSVAHAEQKCYYK